MAPRSIVSKACPTCMRPNPVAARICTCGTWFTAPEINETDPALAEIRSEAFRKKLRKLALLAVYLVLITGITAWWLGYVSIPGYFRNEVDAESAAKETEGTKGAANADRVLAPIEGSVVSVKSGDTINVSAFDGSQYDVRLSGVDAPEEGQELAGSAREALAALILNKTVRILPIKAAETGPVVGKVFSDGKQINLELIRNGLAWHHKFSKFQSEEDRSLYESAQLSAKAAGIGIWSRPNPTAPWDFRAGETPTAPDEAATGVADVDGSPAQSATAPEQYAPRKQIYKGASRSTSFVAKTPAGPTITVADVPIPAERQVVQPQPAIVSPAVSQPAPSTPKPTAPAASNGDGRVYTLGPRGGCYYISSSGSKSYVDKSRCGQ